MKRTIITAALYVTANLITPLVAQVIDNGAGDYTLSTTPAPPNSFTIGSSYSTGSAFSIRGDEMSVPTGNVFETYSLAGNSTYWRMNRNANEYGHFNNLTGESNFNANAPLGHLRWHTWNIHRMQLNGIQNSTINSFTVPTDGFLGLGGSPVAGTAPQKPWSRLHMHDDTAPGGVVDFGYRDWMRNGVTMTGHGDQMYVGHKYSAVGSDPTDAVFQWADNGTEQQGPDLMRFIFTSDYTGAASGANSLFGKEIMQLHPQGFVGVGDWNAAATDPTERLDVLDGRVRIRQLPDPSGEADGTYRVMVVDDAALPSAERGVVKWVDPSDLVPTDCEWTMNAASPNHVYTAFGTSDPDCPDDVEAVGVGLDLSTTAPSAKLNVFNKFYDIGADVLVNVATLETRGVNVLAKGGTDYNYGVYSEVQGPTTRSRGVLGKSSGADYYGIGGLFISADTGQYTTGAQGHVIAGTDHGFGVLGTCISNAKLNVGVRGHVFSVTDPTGAYYYGVEGVSDVTPGSTQLACGVRGEAVTASGVNSWAVLSLGYQYSSTGPSWTPSDANLKTDIEPLENALEQVMELQPRSYRYRAEEFPHMHLSPEAQYGFLAQELEEVQPQMVRDVHFPAKTDSTGAELQAAMDLKAVKVDGLVPLVIAAMQEQQELIAAQQDALEELQSQVSDMQQALAACCANPGGNNMITPTGTIPTDGALDTASDRKLRIVPNPFSEPPTVFYTLDRAGRMQLIANSADGKELNVLHEATMQVGDYQYAWDTTNLAPGMYYVTLLMDGKPLVKKAVKVTR